MKNIIKELIKMLCGIIALVLVSLIGFAHLQARIKEFHSNEVDIYVYCGAGLVISIAVYLIIVGNSLFSKTIYYDLMTEIRAGDWVIRKGGMLHHRKKLSGYAALFLNIKDFKYFNQKFSNVVGDRILTDYAQCLDQYIKKIGYVGRLGGDNFLIYIKKEELDHFVEFLDEIYIDVNRDGEIETIKVNARAGILEIPEDIEYRQIINCCSAALTNAKEKKMDFVYFEEDMIEKMIESKETLAACKTALEKQEFIPYYQPKVDADSNALCGAEALVRWKRGSRMIAPYQFVPILEQHGKITELDFYMFEHVCMDIRKWLDAGIEPVRVSTNFSKLHLKNPDFATEIFAIQDRYNIDSKYIEVELTESSSYEDFDSLIRFTKTVRERGIHVSIDDFGTGYSSLSMLRDFKVDVIKLDKSFLDQASSKDEQSLKFLQDIIKMIDHQDEMILCEGVEKESQLAFLRDAGCDIIQGYFFDKPMPVADFEKRLLNPQY